MDEDEGVLFFTVDEDHIHGGGFAKKLSSSLVPRIFFQDCSLT